MRQLLAEALLLASMGTLAGLSLHWYLTRLLNELSLPLPIPIAFQIAPDFKLVLYSILPHRDCRSAGRSGPGVAGDTAWAYIRLENGGAAVRLSPVHFPQRPDCGTGGDHRGVGQRRLTLRQEPGPGALASTRASICSTRRGPRVSVLSDRYAKDRVFLFASRLLETADGVPGVRSAALAEVVPFNNFMRIGTLIQTKANAVKAEYYGNSVSPAYFEAMGIPIVAGRPFATGDRKGAPDVVILNDALARRLFGKGSAVGERIWFGDRKEGPGVEIVGVAANSKHLTMGENQAFAVYEPIDANAAGQDRDQRARTCSSRRRQRRGSTAGSAVVPG